MTASPTISTAAPPAGPHTALAAIAIASTPLLMVSWFSVQRAFLSRSQAIRDSAKRGVVLEKVYDRLMILCSLVLIRNDGRYTPADPASPTHAPLRAKRSEEWMDSVSL